MGPFEPGASHMHSDRSTADLYRHAYVHVALNSLCACGISSRDHAVYKIHCGRLMNKYMKYKLMSVS